MSNCHICTSQVEETDSSTTVEHDLPAEAVSVSAIAANFNVKQLALEL